MTDHIPDEVSPAGRDLRAYIDELRPDHPVVRKDSGEWVVLRHDLVRRVALDDPSFSNLVYGVGRHACPGRRLGPRAGALGSTPTRDSRHRRNGGPASVMS